MSEQDFLQNLAYLDRLKLTVRDVLILQCIITNPGICGLDTSLKLGAPNRSAIHAALQRLTRKGFIEDKRPYHQKAIPAAFYVTMAGMELWQRIKP